jgi:hypothetical protein
MIEIKMNLLDYADSKERLDGSQVCVETLHNPRKVREKELCSKYTLCIKPLPSSLLRMFVGPLLLYHLFHLPAMYECPNQLNRCLDASMHSCFVALDWYV